MKKSYLCGIAAAAMLSATPALAANNNNVQTTPLTGPYVGVYGGYDWTDTGRADPRGWDGGLYAGYKLDKLLGSGTKDYGIGANGAIEVFYGISNAKDRSGGVTVTKEDEWGVSFRPGISVFDRFTGDMGINPYGIVGYRSTKFETTTNSDRYDGFELGIGTELFAQGNIGMRVEYAHTWYGSEGGLNPDSDDVRVGLSYHF